MITRKEIAIFETLFHEYFDLKQDATCDEDKDIYQAQMDAIDELEQRLGIDSSAYWIGEGA